MIQLDREWSKPEKVMGQALPKFCRYTAFQTDS
jgi:hypothetical protein